MNMPSLAERLGYNADDRLLIVNCDDFGSSRDANNATLECFERGIASSATLMVPCPWALDAVRRSTRYPVGVHLTLTSEYPSYRWRGLTSGASLLDGEGYLPRTAEEVHRAASLHEVREECRAQIAQALSWGLDVTHIDAHMGTAQTDPRFFAVYVDLAAEFDLPLRMVGTDLEATLGFPCRSVAALHGLIFPDYFVSPWGRPTREVLLEALENLPAGVTEIYAHPVTDGEELRAYDPKHADVRVADYACLMDAQIRERIQAAGVRLISFRELRELQRA